MSHVEPQQLGLGYQVMQGQLQLAQRDAYARYNRERMGKAFNQSHPKSASVPLKPVSSPAEHGQQQVLHMQQTVSSWEVEAVD